MENEDLKAKVQRLKIYQKKFLGYLIILASVIIFSLTISLNFVDINLVLIFIFIITLIGVTIFLLFIYSPKTTQNEVMNTSLKRVIVNLGHLLESYDIEEYSIFLSVDDQMFQFLPFSTNINSKKIPIISELNENDLIIKNKGIILQPIGLDLIKYIEDDNLRDQIKNNLEILTELLQKILIEDLSLVNYCILEKLEKGQYKLTLQGSIFADLYQITYSRIKVISQINCPISNFIGVLLAKTTNRAIIMRSKEFNNHTNELFVIYELSEFYPS